MDFFNRPPPIAEDTLEYCIHPGPSFHDKPSVTALAALIDSYVTSVLPNHIWNRDTFELKVFVALQDEDKWKIEGRMRVGDSVEDEWCVVWLLRDISRRWDVAVSVLDSDGEFLLIEAADHLPTWVTPINAVNRVWIYQGHLHIVPLQYVSAPTTKREHCDSRGGLDHPGTDDCYISIPEALRAVRNTQINTLVSPEIERTAMQRTEGYPALAHQHLHRTKVYLPRDIVIALSKNPWLVQKAIEAFYTRDAIQMRAATRMLRFHPDSSILALVTMTRVAYAKLAGQKFHPPKIFGQWRDGEETSEWRWKDMGMKIACGFEMLYQETKRRHQIMNDTDGGDASREARKDALRRDPEYTAFVQRLQNAGYFGYEIEDSSAWKDKENQAAVQFDKLRLADNSNRPTFTFMVDQAISHGERDTLQTVDIIEDSAEWLNADESTMDGMLTSLAVPQSSQKGGGEDIEVDEAEIRESSEDKLATKQAGQLRKLAGRVEKFVEGEGDLEGAMFEDDLISEEDMLHEADSDDDSLSDGESSEVQSALYDRQAAMDNLVPKLEASEYGKMPPSFHCNSQQFKNPAVVPEPAHVKESLNQDARSEPRSVRPLIFPRDQFDGVEDSDDESEGGDVAGDNGEDGEDQPTVVGEVDIDMLQEEEEFLKFSREALGITPDMWNDIVQDRKGRGGSLYSEVSQDEGLLGRKAFLPDSALLDEAKNTQAGQGFSPTYSQPFPDSSQRHSDSEQHSDVGPRLQSFEAVMQAMDAELSRAERGLPTELQDSNDEGSQKDTGASMDYTLIKNFLESFKCQQGLSGPVNNLVGRLQPEWKLPRDEK